MLVTSMLFAADEDDGLQDGFGFCGCLKFTAVYSRLEDLARGLELLELFRV